jgi:hypothetical protein
MWVTLTVQEAGLIATRPSIFQTECLRCIHAKDTGPTKMLVINNYIFRWMTRV